MPQERVARTPQLGPSLSRGDLEKNPGKGERKGSPLGRGEIEKSSISFFKKERSVHFFYIIQAREAVERDHLYHYYHRGVKEGFYHLTERGVLEKGSRANKEKREIIPSMQENQGKSTPSFFVRGDSSFKRRGKTKITSFLSSANKKGRG